MLLFRAMKGLDLRCWCFSVLFAWTLFGGSCFGGEQEWVEVHSPNFSVVTDAGEKKGRQVAMRFEQMRASSVRS